MIDGWGISCEIALIWISLDFTDDQSKLFQVMAWCCQATSHYLSQCWPRSLLPYNVTRPEWVNLSSKVFCGIHLSNFPRSTHEINLQYVFRDYTLKLPHLPGANELRHFVLFSFPSSMYCLECIWNKSLLLEITACCLICSQCQAFYLTHCLHGDVAVILNY